MIRCRDVWAASPPLWIAFMPSGEQKANILELFEMSPQRLNAGLAASAVPRFARQDQAVELRWLPTTRSTCVLRDFDFCSDLDTCDKTGTLSLNDHPQIIALQSDWMIEERRLLMLSKVPTIRTVPPLRSGAYP